MKMQRNTSAPISSNRPRNTLFGFAGLTNSHVVLCKGRLRMTAKIVAVAVAVLFQVVSAAGQVTSPPESVQTKPKCDNQIRSTYLLGPGDQLEISEPELTELANKPVRVDGDGNIEVPLAGRLHVSGLTGQRTEQELNKALSTYFRNPQ